MRQSGVKETASKSDRIEQSSEYIFLYRY